MEDTADARGLTAVRSDFFALDVEGDVTLVVLHGTGPTLTDHETAEAVRVDLQLLASAAPPKVKLLLDLAGVQLVASPVLAGLIELQRVAREKQGLFKLVIAHEALHETLLVSKLDRHFEIFDSRQAALASFKAPQFERN